MKTKFLFLLFWGLFRIASGQLQTIQYSTSPTGTAYPQINVLYHDKVTGKVIFAGSAPKLTNGMTVNNLFSISEDYTIDSIANGITETGVAVVRTPDNVLWIGSDSGLFKQTTLGGTIQKTSFESNGGNRAIFYGGGGSLIIIENTTTFFGNQYIVRFHPENETTDTIGLWLPARETEVDNFVATVTVGGITYFTWNPGNNEGFLYSYDTLTQTLALVANAPAMLYSRLVAYSPWSQKLYYFGPSADNDQRYLYAMTKDGEWEQMLRFDQDATGAFTDTIGNVYLSGGFHMIDTTTVDISTVVLNETTSTYKSWTGAGTFNLEEGYFFANGNFVGESSDALETAVISYPTAVNTTNDPQIKIYPNPATDEITFSNLPSSTIVIINDLGQEVLKITTDGSVNTNITISSLSQGVYFARNENGPIGTFEKK